MEHSHFIVRAEVENCSFLRDLDYIENWMERLISEIEMEILIDPQAAYCDEINNRGVTGIAALKTSSMTFHAWDESDPAIIQLDVYSCKKFDPNIVLSFLNEFKLQAYQTALLDRKDVFTFIQNEGYGWDEFHE